ncbi:hypothetical protein V6N12_032629 [Hibiscus sabdariffa]|uniref:Uncharacterized protein n=1 Tax=Hibiscus sabdariffa TaxID=183260 RepID=A0ABR2BNV4_9ROSI
MELEVVAIRNMLDAEIVVLRFSMDNEIRIRGQPPPLCAASSHKLDPVLHTRINNVGCRQELLKGSQMTFSFTACFPRFQPPFDVDVHHRPRHRVCHHPKSKTQPDTFRL